MAKKSQYNQKINYFKKETDTKIRLVIAEGEGGRGGREMCWEGFCKGRQEGESL